MAEKSSSELAADAYEASEAAYLAGLRHGRPNKELEALSREVASAADQWQKLAWAEFFSRRDQFGEDDLTVTNLDLEAEKAELLSELWADIRDA